MGGMASAPVYLTPDQRQNFMGYQCSIKGIADYILRKKPMNIGKLYTIYQ
jgi:hypothetical protein